MSECSVIIPVYNAFPQAHRCLSSVISYLPPWSDMLVVDDCSPHGDFRASLPHELANHRAIRWLRNETNLGFVGSCNRAMLLYTEHDVVLLNSDTVVTKGWLEKLRSAATSRPRIGTVTPLTNNGTIASVPRFLENNPILDSFGIEQWAQLVERVSARCYPELPTCVGFCVYIRRELLAEVGGFDPLFGKGYGEENDLSLRGAAKRFRNILDDATFVYHEGSMSFAEMKDALTDSNAKLLSTRYPHYNGAVANFCASNPLQEVHDRIWNPLVERFIAERAHTVLHILHNGPSVARRHDLGGTELHVRSLVSQDQSKAHFSLSPHGGSLFLTAHTPHGERHVALPDTFDLACLISQRFFDVIHVHHTLGFDLERLVEALSLHNNYIVSFHDYWLVCDKIFLQMRNGEVCDGLACAQSCQNEAGSVEKKRKLTGKLLTGAKHIVVFSSSTQKILERIFSTNLPFLRIPHGTQLPPRGLTPTPPLPDKSEPLRVLFMGTVAPHKGEALLSQLCSHSYLPSGHKVAWHFIGSGTVDSEVVTYHGPYTKETLQSMIGEIQPHVALLVPRCQETYSMTLDELVWCGVPVIVSPYGAPPERVTSWGVGICVDDTVDEILAALARLVTDDGAYKAMRARTAEAPIITLAEEMERYEKLYNEISPDNTREPSALMRFLQPGLS